MSCEPQVSLQVACTCGVPPGRPTTRPGLSALPVEVLEIICQHLALKSRVSLTSCCHSLWSNPCVASSAVLWGDLQFGWRDVFGQVGHAADKEASLAAWLHRRKAGTRRVQLEGRSASDATLHSLAGGSLERLELRDVLEGPIMQDALCPLRHLTTLTRLDMRDCTLCALPASLSALARLAQLDASLNWHLGARAGAPFRALRHLTTLTHLALEDCDLLGLPEELSALHRLAALSLTANLLLGEAPLAAFAPLQHLRQLTRLHLSRCALQRLPPQASALSRLALLRLGHNPRLGSCRGSAWQPLRRLGALTSLELNECSLQVLPLQISALAALCDLDLAGNSSLGWGGESACQALQPLMALTRLTLARCGLRTLPPPLSGLAALAHLDLSWNGRLKSGGKGAFRPLQGLGSLTRVDLSHCELHPLPPKLQGMLAAGILQFTRVD